MFVSGLIYSLKYAGQDTAYSSVDSFYKQKTLKKWFEKRGFDPDRLEFLKEELQKIDRDLQLSEAQRYS